MTRESGKPHNMIAPWLDRRQFVAGATATGAAAYAGSLLGSQPVHAAAPKKGGHLRVGTTEGSTTDLLDPAPDSSAFITMLSSTYLSQLTEVDANGNLQPQLAVSFEANATATQWTFKLRKGVEFHNGKPLVADDVVATINHHRSEESKSSMKAFAAEVADVKADGDHTVVLTLKQGNADYPFILSTGAFSIVPSKDGKADPAGGVGTGAYILDKIEPGVRAQLKRNPNYFNDNVGHFDTAEILVIADAAARNNALVSGVVDIIDKVDLKTVHLLEKTAGVEVLDVTGALHYTLPMNTTRAPVNDNNVRLALKHAVDREELLE
ncbi:MAG: ABC transporter substrate-binding protein, partial [Aestuariivirgaceae bacterium]